ncbi:MAG: HDOD domain-containing protein [FCB group bacterium]|nr:HDOD domain-containing protein [FCB group bacterium]
MNADIYKKLLEEHKELSSLPQTLAEVLRVTKDDVSSAKDLSSVISKDPALTAKLLRIVNSPYYGAGREITTLTQAVVTLGTRAVTALALSTSVYDITGKWVTTVDRVRFWRHSLEAAIACRTIAEAIRYPRIEEAFVAGLLHDLGVLVLENSFPEKYKSIWKHFEAGESLTELEENTWGTNHARVGQFLLEQWNIPLIICESVGQHHHHFPPDTFDADFRLPQIVALGNIISKFTIVKAKPILDTELSTKEMVRKNLKLPPERLSAIEENLFKQTVEEARFLEIDIGSIDEILLEANRMLYHHYLTVENLLRENSKMQREIARTKMEKAALETLRTITATFNHYINNAVATILGRAQLIEYGVDRGDIVDKRNKVVPAVKIIINGVDTIQLVLDELKNLHEFTTTVYHDDTYIIDIEKKIKERLEKLNKQNELQSVN